MIFSNLIDLRDGTPVASIYGGQILTELATSDPLCTAPEQIWDECGEQSIKQRPFCLLRSSWALARANCINGFVST